MSLKREKVESSTLAACLVKAGFVILATRGIEERGNRENQLNGVIAGAQRAPRKVNGIKESNPSGAGFGEEYFRTSDLSEVLLLRTEIWLLKMTKNGISQGGCLNALHDDIYIF